MEEAGCASLFAEHNYEGIVNRFTEGSATAMVGCYQRSSYILANRCKVEERRAYDFAAGYNYERGA